MRSLGIENLIEQSASYIDGWLEVFRKDRKILIEAASAAQRAADYILGMSHDEEGEQDENAAGA